MAENGVFGLEAEAIVLTAWKRQTENRIKFDCGEVLTIVCVYGDYAKAFETVIPDRVRQQSFVLA